MDDVNLGISSFPTQDSFETYLNNGDSSPSYELYDESEDACDLCDHDQTVVKDGLTICTECGLQLESTYMTMEKEWRYYGSNDNKHHSNPSRCHYRKPEERSIRKDVESMNFPPAVVEIADGMYREITVKKNKIYRGSSRKAVIFACIFNAYKKINQPQDPLQIASRFGLEKKTISNGAKLYSSCMGNRSQQKYITPLDLIPCIMKQFNASSDQIEDVKNIYHQVKNKSSILNRSNPQSFSCGLVYYYCQRQKELHKKEGVKRRGYSRKEFSEKVHLSEITLVKIGKEINRILKTEIKL